MPTQTHTPTSTTLTVRLKTKVKDDLDRLCKSTKRSRSFLAAEAVEAYVKYEMEMHKAVERARRDYKAGRLVAHDEAMDRLDAAIEKVARSKK